MRGCCFTGHRPDKLPADWHAADSPMRLALRHEIAAAVEEGFDTFYCGMARGIDTLAAEETLALRDGGAAIRLIGAIPCPAQEAHWPEEERRRYGALAARLDERHFSSPTYDKGCMQQRNRYMVDRSERIIAIYDGSPTGGTAYTLRYAAGLGREFCLIPLYRRPTSVTLLGTADGAAAYRLKEGVTVPALMAALGRCPLMVTESLTRDAAADDPLGVVKGNVRYPSVAAFLRSNDYAGSADTFTPPTFTLSGRLCGVGIQLVCGYTDRVLLRFDGQIPPPLELFV